MTATKISENHLEKMLGGVKITPRNLIFLTIGRSNKNFDNSNLDETLRWRKSSLTFYYFNSFIDSQKEKREKTNSFIITQKDKKEESNKTYIKDNFINEIYNSFKKEQKNLIINTANDISEEEMLHEIFKNLKEIQISSINETFHFNFKFREFVNVCLEVPIPQSNLEYILNQIENTINLLNNSSLSNEFLYSFYQIKIIGNFFNKLLENIGEIKVE
jgi:hypothetical protein